ncbi:MAG: M50 family metallopeptidase [Chloroflexi bacterium]|nr:M50 family metallopeptidase [Chloroflexota bacterium]
MLHDPHFRRRALLPLAALIVFILWNTPQLSFVLYPFRLFVTYVHEAGHGLAAILTGGRLLEFHVFPDGSGVATTAGGLRAVILPAGYLGAALFGALLFFVANRFPFSRTLSAVIGVLLIGFTLLFGLSSIVAVLVGLAFGAALLALARFASRDINLIVLNILALLTGLNAVLDLWLLTQFSDVRLGELHNDAAAFARDVIPFTPAWLWAGLWALLAVLMLAAAAWYSIVHPLRRRPPA